MGDPYSEDEARRLLDDLVRTSQVDRAEIVRAADLWKRTATELEEIAAQFGPTSPKWDHSRSEWFGEASGMATAAFDALATQFTQHAGRMRHIGDSLARGEAAIGPIADRINSDVGTELKPKPSGGFLGTGIGPDVGPDVVSAAKEVYSNPVGAVLAPSGLAAGMVAYEVVTGGGDLSREEQFNAIKELHSGFSGSMTGEQDSLRSAYPESGGSERGSVRSDQPPPSPGGGAGGGPSAYPTPGSGGASHSATALGVGGPTPYRNDPLANTPGYTPSPIGGAGGTPSTFGPGGSGVTADSSSSMDGSRTMGSPTGDPRLGYSSGAPIGSGSGAGAGGAGIGAGLLGGSMAAGGAAAGAYGASKAAGAAAARGAGVSGVLGGAAGAAGATTGGAGGTGTGAGTGAGARPGGMGMMGGMAGGAGGGAGGGASGSGARYGTGPQLSERDRRRRPRHAVLGAGSRRPKDEDGDREPNAGRGPDHDRDEDGNGGDDD